MKWSVSISRWSVYEVTAATEDEAIDLALEGIIEPSEVETTRVVAEVIPDAVALNHPITKD